MRTFSSFAFDVVEKLFNLTEVDTLPLLTEWTEATIQDKEEHEKMLTRISHKLFKKARIWNEDELKLLFIGPLIEATLIDTNEVQTFTQRTLSAIVNGEEIGGRVDFMIAKGRKVPEAPYFCIHEYKQEPENSGDPLGQVLIAMAIAQLLNAKEIPILGSYIVGRNWFFIVLIGNEYTVSNEYNASSKDIFQIFAILQKSKEIIQRYI
jgi:hypothetical protein